MSRRLLLPLCLAVVACTPDENFPDASTDASADARSDAPVADASSDGPGADARERDAAAFDATNHDGSTDAPSLDAPSFDGGAIDPLLRERLYPDFCVAGLSAPPGEPSRFTRVEPGGDIQSAIDAAADGEGVMLATGVHRLASTLGMRAGVVVRGEEGARLETTQSMGAMVDFGGGYGGSENIRIVRAPAFSRVIETETPLTTGFWIIGDGGGGQMVRVLSVEGTEATLEMALGEDFGEKRMNVQRDPIMRAGLENVELRPLHPVADLIVFRSASDCWLRGVSTLGEGGQVRSAVYFRQAYRNAVLASRFDNAQEHGDGGEGYGINMSNNSSGNLIEGNTLRRLRHSMLIQEGAAVNVFRDNDSADPLHPNFVDGGPADMSFHAYASANLVVDNRVDRIQTNDAGEPGSNNVIAFNTLRSGPLTLDLGVDALTLLGNRMEGDVDTLRARIMPPLMTDSSVGNPSPERSFWLAAYDPFEGPGGSSGFTERGVGILDWDSGEDVYVDEEIVGLDFCAL